MAKSTAPKTKSSAPPPSKHDKRDTDVRALKPHVPSEAQIAARAFELYAARGEQGGDALGDWLKAEAELRVARD